VLEPSTRTEPCSFAAVQERGVAAPSASTANAAKPIDLIELILEFMRAPFVERHRNLNALVRRERQELVKKP
jgi:hypothetical protein